MPNIVNSNLSYDNSRLNHRYEFNNIKEYIDDFINEKYFDRFMVLPGLRGVGKTTILYQVYDYLLNEKKILPDQILYFSCEDLNDFIDCNIRDLVEIYLKTKHSSKILTLNKKIFILIDETQYASNWSIECKIIYDQTKNIFMIFTGSSALNLEYNADAARRMNKYTINPLNYCEHIKLKYNLNLNKMSKSIYDLLFNKNIEEAIKCEQKVDTILTNNIKYLPTDWEEYLKYGGFPALFNKKNHLDVISALVDMSKKIINSDLSSIENFNTVNQVNANRILRFLVLQKPGEISQVKLANMLEISSSKVNKILEILEKTHLIFHCEPYGLSSKRINKAWKYYFATSSLRHALSFNIGNPMKNEEFEGILIENLVASTLFNLSNRTSSMHFNIFYDPSKKTNVDFIVNYGFENNIPIEVGRGKKDKRQIKRAINNYNSEFGIVVSSKTHKITKEDDVIFIPLRTFSFL